MSAVWAGVAAVADEEATVVAVVALALEAVALEATVREVSVRSDTAVVEESTSDVVAMALRAVTTAALE